MPASVGSSTINLYREGPVIDYTSMDYASIVADLKTFAQASFSDRWTDFNEDQFAKVFLDLIGYCHDMMSFYLNATLRSVTVQTAIRRQHIVQLGKSYDYALRSASSASGPAVLVVQGAVLPKTISKDAQFSVGPIYFQPSQDYTLTVANATSGPDAQGNYTFGGLSSPPLSITFVEGQGYTNQQLGVSDGTREQAFTLPEAPLIDDTLIVSVNGVAWTKVTSFLTSGSAAQVYRVETDDNDVTTIYFGDNVNGKIPPITHVVSASFKVGGGRRGRVGASTTLQAVTSITGLVSASLPSGSTGGEDQETLNHARQAIPANLSAGDRAVTIKDYATIAAKANASVAKAAAIELETKLIKLVVAPSGGGFATDALKSTVSEYVAARHMVGRRHTLVDPYYVPCSVELDLYVDSAVQRDVLAAFVKAMFLTTDTTAQQVGILDFNNVGFRARDDDDTPLLTVQRVYNLLKGLGPKGVQTSNLLTFTTKPAARPINLSTIGNGTFSFTTNNGRLRQRRQWRIVFTSSTTYNVYERVFGHITSLTPLILTDDRQTLSGNPAAGVAVLNPNTRQSTTYPVSSYPAATQVAVAAGQNLFGSASKGDPFYIEWPASPSTGTVGVAYTPVDVVTAVSKGFSWTFTAGAQPWASGDAYLVTVFQMVDNIILADDEIPQLSSTDLVVNVKTAV